MKKLLLIAALSMSVAGGAIAQETGSGEEGGANSGSGASSGGGAGAEGTSPGGGDSTSDSTNAPNAPFLGNRDRIGAFFTDDTMTTMRTGDEFNSAYQSLSDDDRAQLTEECASDNGGNRTFCDAFTSTAGTTAQ